MGLTHWTYHIANAPVRRSICAHGSYTRQSMSPRSNAWGADQRCGVKSRFYSVVKGHAAQFTS